MHHIIIPGLYGLAGLMAYTTVYHFSIGMYPPRDRAQILFACLSLCLVPFTLSMAPVLGATDPVTYVHALKINLSAAILMFAVFPWFTALYTGVRPLPFLIGLSLLFAVIFVANLVHPYTLQFDSLGGLYTVRLPWGESITRAHGGHHGGWGFIGMAAVAVSFAYTLVAMSLKYRRQRQLADLAILLAIVLFLLTVVQGILVRLDVLHGIELGPFGFIALVLCISAALGYSTQRRLRTSERHFRALFENSPTGMLAVAPPDGRIVQANPVALRMTGYSADEILDKTVADLICPEDLADYRRRYEQLVSGQVESTHYERRYRTKDGNSFIADHYVSSLKDEHGKVVRFIANITDITERKQTEQALANSEERFRQLFDNMPEAFAVHEIICDEDGRPVDYRFLEVNPAFETLTGIKAESLIGKTVLEVLPATESFWIETYGKVALTGEPVSFQNYAQALERYYDVRAFCPRPGQFATIFRDVTAQKSIEHELAQNEDKHRTIFENSPLGIFRSTSEGRFIEANPAMARMNGYDSPEDLIREVQDIGKQLYTDPEERLEILARLQESPGGIIQYQHTQRRRDGSEYLAHVTLKQAHNADGSAAYIDGIIEDVTSQKLAEEEREKLQAQLNQAQKMDSIGRLAGGIAHDFNNMLGVIIAYSDLALRQASGDMKLSNHLEEIRNAANRSADLTRQLLTFARKQASIPEALDLNQAVEGMLKMLQRMITEDISLDWLPADKLWLVKADPSQVDQILANLCVNARDAIKGGGRIAIATGNETFNARDCARHPEARPGDYVRLSVSDNGSGMDAETLSHVFEPFFTTKDLGQGTGLGLATVYGIVQQSKGFIHVYSELGHGTTFNIYLPRYGGTSVQTDDKAGIPTFARGSEHILLVEDEAAILEVARSILEECGYKVLAVQSPEEALRIAGEHAGDIDMLITDIIMPGMNGQELAQKLSSLSPRMRCLYMSGYSGDTIVHQGVLEEGIHFIQKPFSMAGLAAKVREVLDEA